MANNTRNKDGCQRENCVSSNIAETTEGAVSVMIDGSDNNRNHDKGSIYGVTFQSTTLGLVFDARTKHCTNEFVSTIVKEITKEDHREKVDRGDVLISVQDTTTEFCSLVENKNPIALSSKGPLTLRFRKNG